MIVNVNVHHPRVHKVHRLVSGAAGDFYVEVGDRSSVALFFTTAEWEKFVADVNEKRSELDNHPIPCDDCTYVALDLHDWSEHRARNHALPKGEK